MDSNKLLQWVENSPNELERDRFCALLLRSLLTLTDQEAGIIALREEDGYRLAAAEPTFPSWHDVVIPDHTIGELVTLESPRAVSTSRTAKSIAEAARGICEFLRMRSSGAIRFEPTLLLPLRSAREARGIVVLSGTENGNAVSEDDIVMLHSVSMQATRSLESAELFERVCASMQSFAEHMADAIDAKDPHAHGHSRSVSHYAGMIARQMGMSAREVHAIEFAGLLHDIGRLGIPDEILLKDGRLSKEELDIVRSYPVRGAELIAKVDGMESVVPLVLHHAERYDGTGYPDGLKGADIPLGARVLAVAHTFVAMISQRAYRGRMTVVGGALKALDAMSGATLDAGVVNAFLSALGRSRGKV